ncbi:Creatinase/Prolidase N-terminal domain-containing protein [Mycena vulgaris]|nr:Creatinase/Prolidase N-terminal domain-containing protein [Mycena vulgaris]
MSSQPLILGRNVEPTVAKADTVPRLAALQAAMQKRDIDYYIIPSENAHQSEYVAPKDRRREFISGFTGLSGTAVVSGDSAYLITDARHWLQAQEEVDANWQLVRAEGPEDWIDWVVEIVKSHARGQRIGIDVRMISHERATRLAALLGPLDSKLSYVPQNLVDLVWRDAPPAPNVHVSRPLTLVESSGQETSSTKLNRLRNWISVQPPAFSPDREVQNHVGTLITSLPSIAYLLNLQGSDIPPTTLFHAYLFGSPGSAILFLDPGKVNEEIAAHLHSIEVERRDHTDVWVFLRRRGWVSGPIIIAPQTSWAISLMLSQGPGSSS